MENSSAPTLSTPSTPSRSSNAIYLVTIFFISIILVIGAGILTFLLFKSYEVVNIQEEKITSLTDNITAMAAEKTVSEKEMNEIIEEINNQVTKYQGKIEKIALYNEVYDYIFDLMVQHPTLVGFTEKEYQTCLAKAQATGDAKLISAVEALWHNRDGKPVARITLVMQAICNGIKIQTAS